MNVLISSCFLIPTRYDGGTQNKPHIREMIDVLKDNNINLIPACPEQLGGLPTPRVPAEIVGSKVFDANGCDVTENFELGAQNTVSLARELDIDFAILKEGSPSCGSNQIYDGTHSQVKILGKGLTVQMLEKNSIRVFSEHDIESIKGYICKQKT